MYSVKNAEDVSLIGNPIIELKQTVVHIELLSFIMQSNISRKLKQTIKANEQIIMNCGGIKNESTDSQNNQRN